MVKEAALFDHEYFFKLFKMTPRRLELLLSWVAPLIKINNIRRETIEPNERLCITLRYLITSIAASYRVNETSMSRIVRSTCQVIWDVLLKRGFKRPRQQKTSGY